MPNAAATGTPGERLEIEAVEGGLEKILKNLK
jgi:hypothetical protein